MFGIAGGALVAVIVAAAIALTVTARQPAAGPPAMPAARNVPDLEALRGTALASRERAGPALAHLSRLLARCAPRPSVSEVWRCADVAVRQEVMRGRMEALMLAGAVREMPPGRCREVTGALGSRHATLSGAAYDTQLAMQGGRGPQARAALGDLRSAVAQTQALVRAEGWRACRPVGAAI